MAGEPWRTCFAHFQATVPPKGPSQWSADGHHCNRMHFHQSTYLMRKLCKKAPSSQFRRDLHANMPMSVFNRHDASFKTSVTILRPLVDNWAWVLTKNG